MVTKRVIAVAATVLLASVAFAQTPPAAKPAPRPAASVDLAEAASGEVIYMRYCAACHGRSLKGDGPATTGTEAPSAESAVKRITHFLWAQQVKGAPAKK